MYRRKQLRRMKRDISITLAIGILAAALFIAGPAAAAAGAVKGDYDDLLGFVTGSYSVIGKKPGSSETYSGTVTIKRSGSRLKMVRCIGGARYTGEGSIVPVTGDRIPNVIYHWFDGDRKYEGRYEIHSDIDNYARLSGPYVRTASDQAGWGWEMLYVDGGKGGECR